MVKEPARDRKATTRKRITRFQYDYRWLSNFYMCPIYLDGRRYRSVEHAYQAAKTTRLDERDHIRRCNTPGQAKREGRKVTLRPDWEDVKIQIMHELLRQKFRGTELQEPLLATGDAELIEGNTWNDRFWGCVRVGRKWAGQNWLGRLLMDVRVEIRDEGNRNS